MLKTLDSIPVQQIYEYFHIHVLIYSFQKVYPSTKSHQPCNLSNAKRPPYLWRTHNEKFRGEVLSLILLWMVLKVELLTNPFTNQTSFQFFSPQLCILNINYFGERGYQSWQWVEVSTFLTIQPHCNWVFINTNAVDRIHTSPGLPRFYVLLPVTPTTVTIKTRKKLLWQCRRPAASHLS